MIKQKEQISDTKKEFNFISSSIISQVFRGILVGIFAGLVVGAFRLLIEKSFHLIQAAYMRGRSEWIWLVALLFLYAFIVFVNARLVATEKDIKGSGIPQVEAELKGLMSLSWWSVLWKKFVLGILAIASGLMLGREGPSIQLGAMSGKGVSKFMNLSAAEERALIASGAAAGLAAAFNAPIAGLLFVVEEVYRHFSRFFWVSTLAASLVANFVSLSMFGLTPVLDMPDNIPVMKLEQYWIYLVMGLLLGLSGYIYEKVILNIQQVYQFLGRLFRISEAYYPILASVLILPIGYFLPHLLGGGNQLILSLTASHYTVGTLLLFFILRFVWSMLSYGSGLPGGIFLPILALGSLLGGAMGTFCLQLGLISQEQFPIFIILGMSGYFGAISKAPLTAMILFTMLEKMLPDSIEDQGDTTLIEIPVSEKIAGRQVHELNLPDGVLITMNVHKGKTQTVNGSTRLYLGDTIYLVLKKTEIGKVKEALL